MPYCKDCDHYEPAADPDRGYCSGQVVWGRRDVRDCPVAAFRKKGTSPAVGKPFATPRAYTSSAKK